MAETLSEGLIAITPGIEGEIEQSLLNDKEEYARDLIRKLEDIFGSGNFFLSIQNHHLEQELQLNKLMHAISQEMNIPLIATNRVHYLEKEDMFAQECLLAIKNGDKLQDDHREKLESDQFYLKTAAEMTERFSEVPEALENTLRIAERCNVNIELNKTYLPVFPTENGIPAEEYLEVLCKKGLDERFGAPSRGIFGTFVL